MKSLPLVGTTILAVFAVGVFTQDVPGPVGYVFGFIAGFLFFVIVGTAAYNADRRDRGEE